MNKKSPQNLKAIRFADELLPDWAQLLDLAARLCPVSEEVRHWFSKFTTCSGVDDSRTVTVNCELLRSGIQKNRGSILDELRRTVDDAQPAQIAVLAEIFVLGEILFIGFIEFVVRNSRGC